MSIKNKSSDYKIIIELLKKYIKAFITGVLFTIGGCLLTSFVYFKLNSNISLIYFIPYFFIITGAFFTGFISQNKFKKRGVTVGLISSVPLVFVTLLFNLIIVGKVGIFYSSVVFLQIFSSATGGIISANLKKIY